MPLRPFKPFRIFRPFRYVPGGGGGGSPVLMFHFIAPDESSEMQGVLEGQGDLSVGRTSDIWWPDHEGVNRQFEGGEDGYRDGRVDLDPTKLFATLTVTAGTPNPLVALRATFNDGSTHREKYSTTGAYIISESTASGVDNKYRPPDGWLIDVYLGNPSALTVFFCYSNNLTGNIPDISACAALEYLHCAGNQLTGSIPDLSANTALNNFFCYNNQLTGTIPDISANTALALFNCGSNQLTGEIPTPSPSNIALTDIECSDNQLTGTIPNLSDYSALLKFSCHQNSLTGSIPDLSANTVLKYFSCYENELTGNIPDLSANTALDSFYCGVNQLTGFDGGWPNKAIFFRANSNMLTESAVNQILIDADTYGIATGTTIHLNGGANAAPTGAGITARDNLIANGASVSTN